MYYKGGQVLLQNEAGITKSDRYYKEGQLLLQSRASPTR